MRLFRIPCGTSMIEINEPERLTLRFRNYCNTCDAELGLMKLYIPSLNEMICESCYNKWAYSAKYNRENAIYESGRLSYVKKKLRS